MTEKTENLNTGGTTLSPLEGEGLRGDGTAKWYVIHTYSGYENKVKTNIEKIGRVQRNAGSHPRGYHSY